MTELASALPAAGPVAMLGPDWLDPDYLINSFTETFGVWAIRAIAAVIFVETGLLFPFLPGDSLLFTAGALVAQDQLDFPLWLLCLVMFLAAFLGDQTAYLIGRKAGPRVFQRPDSRIFKQKYVDQTYAYFDKYGGRTIVVARFVPFVRTYAPVAAGVGRMHYRHFVSYNVIGAFLWGVGVTVLGYALGTIPFVKANIEYLLVVLVLLSLVPIAIEAWRHRRNPGAGRDERYDEQHERDRVQQEDIEQ